jgi:hypothetical protein
VRIDRRLVGLGLLLVTAGGVMLAVRQGLIPDAVAQRAWTLWPLLLVGSGLSIVLAGRPGAALGGLVVAITLGTMIGGIAATGWSGGFGVCTGNRDGTPFAGQEGALTPGSSVRIAASCGDLDVSTAAGTVWTVSGSSSDGRPPTIGTPAGGLSIENPRGAAFEFGGPGNRWSVVLPSDPRFDLDVSTNGGSSRVVLDGAALRDASFETNAGSLTVDLRGVTAIADVEIHTNFGSTIVRLPPRSLTGSIDVNAGSASICVPTGAGLRVEIDTVAGSNDLAAHGLVRTGDDNEVWETPGFAAAGVRLALTVDVTAGRFALDPARACAG